MRRFSDATSGFLISQIPITTSLGGVVYAEAALLNPFPLPDPGRRVSCFSAIFTLIRRNLITLEINTLFREMEDPSSVTARDLRLR